MNQPRACPSIVVQVQTDLARKLYQHPCRVCHIEQVCCLCWKRIDVGDAYYDGDGELAKAHAGCVEELVGETHV